MALEKEYLYLNKRKGIYYTNYIYGDEGDGTFEAEKIVGTDDVDLIDTRIDQTSARHVKKDVVIVRGRG